MKAIRYLLIVILILNCYNSICQIKLDWSLAYHPIGNVSNFANVVNDQLRVDSQGNILCAWQNTINQFPQYSSIGITSYSSNGNLNWEHDYAGSFGSINDAYSCQIDSLDNVYVMGQVNVNTFVEDDVNIKYDVSGNQLWKAGDDSSHHKGVDIKVGTNNYFKLNRWQYIYKYNNISGSLIDSILVDTIIPGGGVGNIFLLANKNELIAFGQFGFFTGSNAVIYLFKADTSGYIYWKKSLDPTPAEDIPFKASNGEKGGFYLLSEADYYAASSIESAFVSAHDSTGDTLWTRIYNPTPGLDHCYASDILADHMGHVYITAYALNVATSRSNAVVVQYDALTGHKNWEAWYDSSLSWNDGGIRLQMDSAGYIYMGYNRYKPTGFVNFDIVKLDSAGNTIWHTSFDTIGESNAFVYDGAGNFYCGGAKLSKFSLVSGINEIGEIKNILNIYPNPAINSIGFNNIRRNNESDYSIFDLAGRKIKYGLIPSSNTIDISDVQPGFYLVNLTSNNFFYSGEFVKK